MSGQVPVPPLRPGPTSGWPWAVRRSPGRPSADAARSLVPVSPLHLRDQASGRHRQSRVVFMLFLHITLSLRPICAANGHRHCHSSHRVTTRLSEQPHGGSAWAGPSRLPGSPAPRRRLPLGPRAGRAGLVDVVPLLSQHGDPWRRVPSPTSRRRTGSSVRRAGWQGGGLRRRPQGSGAGSGCHSCQQPGVPSPRRQAEPAASPIGPALAARAEGTVHTASGVRVAEAPLARPPCLRLLLGPDDGAWPARLPPRPGSASQRGCGLDFCTDRGQGTRLLLQPAVAVAPPL